MIYGKFSAISSACRMFVTISFLLMLHTPSLLLTPGRPCLRLPPLSYHHHCRHVNDHHDHHHNDHDHDHLSHLLNHADDSLDEVVHGEESAKTISENLMSIIIIIFILMP